jgi:hypothetical protein
MFHRLHEVRIEPRLRTAFPVFLPAEPGPGNHDERMDQAADGRASILHARPIWMPPNLAQATLPWLVALTHPGPA